MDSFTIWYGLKLNCDKESFDDISEYLAMNGYTFDTNCKDTLFIYHEEIDYVITIIEDFNIDFDII